MTVDEGVDISPKSDRGVLKRIIKEGVGSELPTRGSKVFVHYVGTLLDGTKFDSSRDRNEPFEFDLGKGRVIKAWDIGVATMKKGEICMLTCAPEYAYGTAGSPPKIPANSTLQFEVEMIDWEVEDLSPDKSKGILRYTLTPGSLDLTSEKPNDGALVTVILEGKISGKEEVFDSRTVTFNLGTGADHNICEGIEIALEKFQKGEKSKLVIKPNYGFKAQGNEELKVPPNATLEYTVILKEFEKAKESWLMDADEQLEQGRIYKEKGTNYFKKNNYDVAIKMYKKAISLVASILDNPGEKDTKTTAKELTLSAHLNLSLAYLKLSPPQNFEAKDHANDALKLEPNNVKGLFRRGQALLALGDADKAMIDFQKVVELEPTNKAASNHVTLCKTALAQQRAKEKRLYANMFEKFASTDRERERLAAKDQPDVMSEKLGEWGDCEWSQEHRNREPTHFEKENPNILMLDKDGQFQNM